MAHKRTKRLRFKKLARRFARRIQRLNPSKKYKKENQKVREGNHYWDHHKTG